MERSARGAWVLAVVGNHQIAAFQSAIWRRPQGIVPIAKGDHRASRPARARERIGGPMPSRRNGGRPNVLVQTEMVTVIETIRPPARSLTCSACMRARGRRACTGQAAGGPAQRADHRRLDRAGRLRMQPKVVLRTTGSNALPEGRRGPGLVPRARHRMRKHSAGQRDPLSPNRRRAPLNGADAGGHPSCEDADRTGRAQAPTRQAPSARCRARSRWGFGRSERRPGPWRRQARLDPASRSLRPASRRGSGSGR